MDKQLEKDNNTLRELGGATSVARLLKYDLEKGGAQRVQNWFKRGIPAQVKLDNPRVFLK